MFGGDLAVPPDQECDRQSENSSKKFPRLCTAHHHRVVHFEALVEIAHGFRPIIHRNANDLQALASVLILKFDELRDLLPARIAPSCPEVQKDDLAPIGGKIE